MGAPARGSTLAVRGDPVPRTARTAVNGHRCAVRAGHDRAVGKDPHHRHATTTVYAGRTIGPLAEILDNNRHPRIADHGANVEERFGRIQGMLDRIAGGLAGCQQKVVALVPGQIRPVKEVGQRPAQDGHRTLGRGKSPVPTVTSRPAVLGGGGLRVGAVTSTVDEASRATGADHDRLRTPRPPSRSPRPCSARRTTSSTSASRRRRRRPADRPGLDETVDRGPLRWLWMPSRPGQALVEPEGRAAGSTTARGVVRSRFAPVRRGTWPGSVLRSVSTGSV